MADLLFPLALIYFIAIFYAKRRTLRQISLIPQFVIAWGILELSWLNALISVVFLIMAIGDLDDWSFSTLIGFSLSAYNTFLLWEIHQQNQASKKILKQTLSEALGENYKDDLHPDRAKLISQGSSEFPWLKPFSFTTEHMDCHDNIVYGPHERNTLNLFTPKASSKTLRPVMLQIHGGGWCLGHSQYQGLPLRNKLIEAGWIFVSINYRLSPSHKFPAHIVDCKQALCWIKENIEAYGGDPHFIMTTGGSAGGHLSSLLALTENRHQDTLQPGFEEKDTSLQGAIPMYGVYDFADRNDLRFGLPMKDFLEKSVMPKTQQEDQALWDIASPIAQIHKDSPPFFILHGEYDTLAFVEEARIFAQQLKQSSESSCIYAELPQTQHAFDIFYSPRCVHSVRAMHSFAEVIYSRYLAGEFIQAS